MNCCLDTCWERPIIKPTIKQMFNRLFEALAQACRICEHAENAQDDKRLNVRLKPTVPVSKKLQDCYACEQKSFRK